MKGVQLTKKFESAALNHEKQHYGKDMSSLRWRELITEQHEAQQNERNRQMVLYRRDVTLGSKVTGDRPTCITYDSTTNSESAEDLRTRAERSLTRLMFPVGFYFTQDRV